MSEINIQKLRKVNYLQSRTWIEAPFNQSQHLSVLQKAYMDLLLQTGDLHDHERDSDLQQQKVAVLYQRLCVRVHVQAKQLTDL